MSNVLHCVYPGCSAPVSTASLFHNHTQSLWCFSHFGMFPHKCVENGCDHNVVYDDEPRCFTHSPDEGSSDRNYSAYYDHIRRKQVTVVPVPTPH